MRPPSFFGSSPCETRRQGDARAGSAAESSWLQCRVPAALCYTFGGFVLDSRQRRLARGEERIALPERHFEVLWQLVSHAGTVLSKDALVAAAWGDVAVTDNSLEQAISALRRTLGNGGDGTSYIETVPRRGYRFTAAVTRTAARESDAALDALLAPHRAWVEGRAALLTLERDQIERARAVFERMVRSEPAQPLAHIGLANACALLFETTRADERPDTAALATAAEHAREACRLDSQSGEAWATLGFVLDRQGQRVDALAALRRAVALEPDNWRHHFRLSYASWGEERLRAGRRTLALLPGFPLAHWMIATVHVARNSLEQAGQELDAGIASQAHQGRHAAFSGVGLHWLRGLVHLAGGHDGPAIEAFEHELACEAAGHLYGRECCANTWYAIGAVRLRQNRLADARLAFERAVERVAAHPPARIALTALAESAGSSPGLAAASDVRAANGAVEAAVYRAIALVLLGDTDAAAAAVDRALASAPEGNAGWLLPVEPLLRPSSAPAVWAAPLARLRARTA